MIYASHSQEKLCDILAGNLGGQDGTNVFAKELIVTQNPGTNAWLKTELAARNRVFANFRFLNQDGLFKALCIALGLDDETDRKQRMTFTIDRLLKDEPFIHAFPTVAEYYTGNDLRRFQLAGKIADLFDQYQLYREEMVKTWTAGSTTSDDPDEKWQQWLWSRLDIRPKGELKEQLLSALEANREKIREAFPRIAFFGITIYTRFHLDVFRKLAEYTEVGFYLCIPSRPGEFRNELLVSFGAKAAELMQMFGQPEPGEALSENNTLLGELQQDILQNRSSLSVKPEHLRDGSLRVNACYTPAREVECLYNYLLDTLEKNSDIRTQDILVMVPDINTYAPYIRAVFRNAPVEIPIEISGRTKNTDNSITGAIEQVLTFSEDELTSENVISLLESKRMRERFGIRDFNYLRASVRQAGIRFGWHNREEDDSALVSWKNGLDRLILGYAMLTDEPFDGHYPYRNSESSNSHDLLMLKAFVEQLIAIIEQTRSGEMTLTGWKTWMFEAVIDPMIHRDDFSKQDREEMAMINKSLRFMNEIDPEEKISFRIFLDELKHRLFQEPREISLNTGRVTFSPPIPVRGLPYRVIAFIGLDNGVFPRRDTPQGFDLIARYPKPGDRSLTENDKYLFLDTIQSAREKLYLSYIGKSVKDNAELPPSILLDTLLDHIASACPDTDTSKRVYTELRTEHPLHGFSKRYQKDHPRLFTYLYSGEKAVVEEKVKTHETRESDPEPVTVYSFVKFFEHPAIWYFNNILQIDYEKDVESLPEHELFRLNALQKWGVKSNLLTLHEEALPEYSERLKQQGELPLKDLGNYTIDTYKEETKDLKNALDPLIAGKDPQSIAIDIQLGNQRITGVIDGVYGDQLVSWSTSSSKTRPGMHAYLKTLLLAAEGKVQESRFFTENGKEEVLEVPSREEAIGILEQLMEYFGRGNAAPLIFTLDAGKQSVSRTAEMQKTFKKVLDEAEPDYNGNTGFSYPYMRNLRDDGYFDHLAETNEEEQDDQARDEIYRQIQELAGLLNL